MHQAGQCAMGGFRFGFRFGFGFGFGFGVTVGVMITHSNLRQLGCAGVLGTVVSV